LLSPCAALFGNTGKNSVWKGALPCELVPEGGAGGGERFGRGWNLERNMQSNASGNR